VISIPDSEGDHSLRTDLGREEMIGNEMKGRIVQMSPHALPSDAWRFSGT
jgi:hypothetical protein